MEHFNSRQLKYRVSTQCSLLHTFEKSRDLSLLEVDCPVRRYASGVGSGSNRPRESSVALISPNLKLLPDQDEDVFNVEEPGNERNPAPMFPIPTWTADIEHSWDVLSNADVALGQDGRSVCVPTENKMPAESTSDRRDSYRYGLKVPLVFCPMHTPMSNGHLAKSINISSRGVYFVTSHPVFVGLPVQVRLRMPGRVAGTVPTERVFDGRVSHIEWKNVPSGCSGVGVEFFYWEIPRESCQ
jgi:hypothetical protein